MRPARTFIADVTFTLNETETETTATAAVAIETPEVPLPLDDGNEPWTGGGWEEIP
jgi:hypothetical protein